MTKHYKALLLDMDGTIQDSEKMILDSLRYFERERGLRLTPLQYLKALGCSAEEFMDSLGVSDPAAAADQWRSIMQGMIHQVKLYDGMRELLAMPFRRGIVTSQTRKELTFNLERLQIGGAFEATVTVDDVTERKPSPKPLLYCMEQMRLRPEEVLYVGDTVYDYDCAGAAGVDFGLAYWGAGESDKFTKAAHIFKHPAEMVEWIEPT